MTWYLFSHHVTTVSETRSTSSRGRGALPGYFLLCCNKYASYAKRHSAKGALPKVHSPDPTDNRPMESRALASPETWGCSSKHRRSTTNCDATSWPQVTKSPQKRRSMSCSATHRRSTAPDDAPSRTPWVTKTPQPRWPRSCSAVHHRSSGAHAATNRTWVRIHEVRGDWYMLGICLMPSLPGKSENVQSISAQKSLVNEREEPDTRPYAYCIQQGAPLSTHRTRTVESKMLNVLWHPLQYV